MRLAIFSDVHGNLEAFDRFQQSVSLDEIDRFVCLGDLTGYIPNPLGVSHVIESLPEDTIYLRGNHEQMVLDGSWSQQRDTLALRECSEMLNNSHWLDVIKAWPMAYTLECEAGHLLFVHGTPESPTHGYLTDEFLRKCGPLSYQFVFAGNTHRPLSRKIASTTFINVGSVGLPRDHGSIGSYGIIDLRTGKVHIRRFDIGRSIDREARRYGAHSSVADLCDRGLLGR